jgi:hypothetical protein
MIKILLNLALFCVKSEFSSGALLCLNYELSP